MIDGELFDMVAEKLPKMNTDILNGLAEIQTANLDGFLNDVFRCAAESFPKGLKYVGYRSCLPQEVFRECTRKTPRNFEMLQSDVYLTKYSLTYTDPKTNITTELRPIHIYIPFCTDGILKLNGTQYQLTPVLGGKVFNIERGNIYMPIPRQPLGFKPFLVSCYRNGRIVNEHSVYAHLHNGRKSTERSALYPSLIHYMLCKYGLIELLTNVFGLTIMLGTKELDLLNPDEWAVYRSRQLTSIKKQQHVELRIAVKLAGVVKQTDSIIAGIFYILDNAVESTQVITELNHPEIWLFLLDRFIFKTGSGAKAYEKMKEHLDSVESYTDSITKRNLKANDIECNNIYDLFKYMIINYQDLNIHHGNGSMYYKELTTSKHLMYHIVHSIFLAMYALLLLPENLLTAKKIESVLLKNLRSNKIFSTLHHGELEPISNGIASDCKIYSATGNIIPYNKAKTSTGKKRTTTKVPDMGLTFHPSQVEVGTYQWISKRSPTGRNKLNPFVQFTHNWVTIPSPSMKVQIDNLQSLITGD